MLELIGSFTIGFFIGMAALYMYAVNSIDKNKGKSKKTIDEKELKKEQKPISDKVIINMLDEGPAELFHLHGEKARVVNIDTLLYCQIDKSKDVIAVPSRFVVPDNSQITPPTP